MAYSCPTKPQPESQHDGEAFYPLGSGVVQRQFHPLPIFDASTNNVLSAQKVVHISQLLLVIWVSLYNSLLCIYVHHLVHIVRTLVPLTILSWVSPLLASKRLTALSDVPDTCVHLVPVAPTRFRIDNIQKQQERFKDFFPLSYVSCYRAVGFWQRFRSPSHRR